MGRGKEGGGGREGGREGERVRGGGDERVGELLKRERKEMERGRQNMITGL